MRRRRLLIAVTWLSGVAVLVLGLMALLYRDQLARQYYLVELR